MFNIYPFKNNLFSYYALFKIVIFSHTQEIVLCSRHLTLHILLLCEFCTRESGVYSRLAILCSRWSTFYKMSAFFSMHKIDNFHLGLLLYFTYFRFVLESHMAECSVGSFMHKDYKDNLFAFAYRLFTEDFSPTHPADGREILMKQSLGKCKYLNFSIFCTVVFYYTMLKTITFTILSHYAVLTFAPLISIQSNIHC